MKKIINKIEEKSRKIVQNDYFEYFILVIIILAGIVVGLETVEELKNNYFLHTLDNIILWIFVVEIIIRISTHLRNPLIFFYDGWQVFDFIIVSICFLPYFIPEAHTEYFAVLRLARILRLVRILQRIKNLQVLIRSLMKSLPKMVYVMVLLQLLFYIYGVLATDIFGKYEKESFGTIFDSMKTLFFVAFEGWSWIYDLDGIDKALTDGTINDWTLLVFFMSFMVFCAMLLLNLFIGILTSDISDTEAEEKKGKHKVLKKNHTIILGWSQKVFDTIKELFEANVADERKFIVIMADIDVDYMESEIEHRVYKEREEEIKLQKVEEKIKFQKNKEREDKIKFQKKNGKRNELMNYRKNSLKILYRKGSPIDQSHLTIANPQMAKSVIIFPNDEEERPDHFTIQTILGLDKLKCKANIVAEFQSNTLLKIAEKEVNNINLISVPIDEFLSRMIAQTCLQPTLSSIYSEILGFSGSEIYVVTLDELQRKHGNIFLEDKSFNEVAYYFQDCCLLGFIRCNKDNKIINDHCINDVVLNPKPTEKIIPGDKLIILAEDQSKIQLEVFDKSLINHSFLTDKSDLVIREKNIAIIGYNSKTINIITEIDNYESEKTKVTVFVSDKKNERKISKVKNDLKNIKLDICRFNYDKIDNDMTSIDFKTYNHIILLNESPMNIDRNQADAKMLILLLQLRNYQKMQNCYFSILSEIMDKRNVEILEADGKNDYIIGDYIQAGIIAQLSQTAELKEVFCSLLEVEGSEIYLKDITNYLSVLEDVNFYTLMESASRKNEIPIGFLRENKQIEINPKKNIKYSFSDKDKVIVIADRMAH